MPQRSARRNSSLLAHFLVLSVLLAAGCGAEGPGPSPAGDETAADSPRAPSPGAVTKWVPPHQDLPNPWTEPTFSIEMILVAPGIFTMGSPPGEPGREEQEALHDVFLSRPYYLGRFEVTQGQWQRVMSTNPSHFEDCGTDCPVESVNALDIERFLRRLERLTGLAFRLPTEAEWEHACRAGSPLQYSTGTRLTPADANIDARPAELGRIEDSSRFRGRPTPVGSFPPNAWGFHDLHGNVWEWVQDRHCPYPDGPVRDPLGECDSPYLVIRGGSWYYGADSARCALRYTHRPRDSGPSLGFRVALDPPPNLP